MAEGKKIGVVLFQLGGPDSLEAVEPFLYNLFVDPDIIDFPLARLARKPLARRMAKSRAQKVQKLYAAIGGKSPIVEWTRRQSRALEEALQKSIDARVVVAMRYWHPLTDEALRELAKDDWSELILLPLYPQYSKTTTGSSFNEWGRQFPASSFSECSRPEDSRLPRRSGIYRFRGGNNKLERGKVCRLIRPSGRVAHDFQRAWTADQRH